VIVDAVEDRGATVIVDVGRVGFDDVREATKIETGAVVEASNVLSGLVLVEIVECLAEGFMFVIDLLILDSVERSTVDDG